jgi:hypothetical protein
MVVVLAAAIEVAAVLTAPPSAPTGAAGQADMADRPDTAGLREPRDTADPVRTAGQAGTADRAGAADHTVSPTTMDPGITAIGTTTGAIPGASARRAGVPLVSRPAS